MQYGINYRYGQSMKKTNKRIIVMIIIMIGIVLSAFVIHQLFTVNSDPQGTLPDITVGKELIIVIPQDVICDANYIIEAERGEITHLGPFFDMIDHVECEKLINYISENHLTIKPGTYIINQTWSFEQILTVLEFV